MSTASSHPHIYKKKKYVKLKTLEPDTSYQRSFAFASDNTKSGIGTVAKHCNNINQITARIWLKVSKLLSYLGLEKDESEPYSKNKGSFNKFFTDLQNQPFFQRGEDKEKTPNLLPALEELSSRLGKLSDQIPKDLVTENQLKTLTKDFDNRLDQIQKDLKAILG